MVGSFQPRSAHSGSIGAQAREMLVSFLDFASSASASSRSQSRSQSQRHSSSNKSTTAQSNVAIRSVTPIPEPPTPYLAPTPEGEPEFGAASGSDSASTGMWTLSLSVDPPRAPARVRDSQDLVPHTAVSVSASPLDPPANRHPFSMVSADLHPQVGGDSAGVEGEPASPTDSLPISVSDINFRNDEEEEEDMSPPSVRGLASGLGTATSGSYTPARSASTTAMPRFQLPRHPPLPVPRTSPTTPQSYTYTYNTPTPTRLDYGIGSGSGDLGRSAHMRQMSAPDLGARASYQAQGHAPYEAQTPFGRRLAQVRAQAMEGQSQSQIQTQSSGSTQPVSSQVLAEEASRPPGRGLRALPIPPIPFIHLNRSGSGNGGVS